MSGNRNEIYDTAAGSLWHYAVYGPVHGGREFANMAGAALLDRVGTDYQLDRRRHVLELCSGTGEVCRYLATRWGCAVTGIELNEHQLAHARRRLHDLPAPAAKRVRFIQADVTTWHPDQPYDVVLAVDSLALLDDPETAFRTAFEALVPGGHLSFADILSGRELTAAVRERAFEYDGIRPLPEPPGTSDLLRVVGFRDIVAVDISATAVSCFQTIATALTENRARIERVCAPGEYRHWVKSTQFYLSAFADAELRYWRFAARRPVAEELLDTAPDDAGDEA